VNSIDVTILVENTAQGLGLLAEHGLALWLEMGRRRVLFDAGQSFVAGRNAEQLGIDLSSADAIVLSHGHYDHVGGLAEILGDMGPTRVLTHPDALTGKYACNDDGTSRDIGMPASVAATLRGMTHLTLTHTPTEVCDGLFVTGPIPRLAEFEHTRKSFFADARCSQPDNLIDDQAAFIDTPSGVIVITGCAHAGIINTVGYVRTLVPGRPIRAVMGGMHLMNADAPRMDQTVEALRQFDIGHLYPLHCTGFPATGRLWNDFPGQVSTCPVGTRVEFGTE